MKKILMLASVPSMIGQFNIENICILKEIGFEVDVACNFKDHSVWNREQIISLKTKLREMDINYYQIDFSRKGSEILRHIKSYRQVEKLLKKNNYEVIHCHTPIGSTLARLAGRSSRKKGTKVIYTAHGFHFYKGVSIKNWLFFYPIEFLLSYITDFLITINKEDYVNAQKFKMSKLVYIPGVGVDVNKFSKVNELESTILKREEFGLKAEDKILISVGELNQNKNHEIIIHALGLIGREKVIENRIYYIIAGKGDQKDALIRLSKKYNISDRVFILGFRTDVAELYQMSDLFIFPSKREGLSISLIEAISSGLPCIVSNIRGNRDLILDGINGYLVNEEDANEYIMKILFLLRNNEIYSKMAKSNKMIAAKYDKRIINKLMCKLYSSI